MRSTWKSKKTSTTQKCPGKRPLSNSSNEMNITRMMDSPKWWSNDKNSIQRQEFKLTFRYGMTTPHLQTLATSFSQLTAFTILPSTWPIKCRDQKRVVLPFKLRAWTDCETCDCNNRLFILRKKYRITDRWSLFWSLQQNLKKVALPPNSLDIDSCSDSGVDPPSSSAETSMNFLSSIIIIIIIVVVVVIIIIIIIITVIIITKFHLANSLLCL